MSKEIPRPYQLSLFEKAKDQNIIAYLDTGAGKTLCSILLMDYFKRDLKPIKFTDEFLMHLSGGKDTSSLSIIQVLQKIPKKQQKMIFLVPTINLVAQQSSKIRSNTDLEVGEYSSEDLASFTTWDSLGWVEEISRKHVLVITPQMCLNLMRHGFLGMKDDISLLIFDECHHANGKHPYSLLMQEFYFSIDEKDRPRIFGMTASPIFQKATTHQDSLDRLSSLQNSLDCKIVTIEDRSALKGYVAKALEILVEYESSSSGDVDLGGDSPAMKYYKYHVSVISKAAKFCQERLEELNKTAHKTDQDMLLVKNCEAQAKTHSKYINILQQALLDLGAWCAGNAAYLICVKDELLLGTAIFNPQDYDIKPANVYKVDLREPILPLVEFSSLVPHDISPKVNTLIRIILDRAVDVNEDEFRCIIFVDRRATAEVVSNMLNFIAPHLFPIIKSGCVVGASKNSIGVKDPAASSNTRKTFEYFRNGTVNIIVATRVAEEGVDVPACRLVVIFDMLRSNSGYVQSRGRARHVNGSEYIIMVQRDNYSYLQYISKAKMAELMTRNIAISDQSNTIIASNTIKAVDDDELVIQSLLGTKKKLEMFTKLGASVTPLTAPLMMTRYFSGWSNVVKKSFEFTHMNNVGLNPTKSIVDLDYTFNGKKFKGFGNPIFTFQLFQLGEEDIEGREIYSCCLIRQQQLTKEFNIREEESSFSNFEVDRDYGYVYCILIPVLPQVEELVKSSILSHSNMPKTVIKKFTEIREQCDVAFIPIYGHVRLNQKLALSSASFEAAKILYCLGHLNENLLCCINQSSRRDFEFLKAKTNNKHEKVDNAQQFKRRIAQVFQPNEDWDFTYQSYLNEQSVGEDASLPLFVTVLSLGPESGEFLGTFGSCQIENQPKRTLAILSKLPIPTREIPKLLVYFGVNSPCKFECLSWDGKKNCFGSGYYDEEFESFKGKDSFRFELSGDRKNEAVRRKKYLSVNFSMSQMQKIIAFQTRFFDMAIPPNDAIIPAIEDPIKREAQVRESPYYVMPMIGGCISKNPNVVNNEEVEDMLKSSVKLTDVRDPEKCVWELDWKLVGHVLDDQRTSVWNWVMSIGKLLTAEEKFVIPVITNKRRKLNVEEGTKLPESTIEVDEFGHSRSKSIDHQNIDIIIDSSILTQSSLSGGFIEEFGHRWSESADKKRKFEEKNEEEDLDEFGRTKPKSCNDGEVDEFGRLRKENTRLFFSPPKIAPSSQQTMGLFESLYEYSIDSDLDSFNVDLTSLKERVDSIISQTLVSTPHNKTVYILGDILLSRSPNDTFTQNKNKSNPEGDRVISYFDYFTQIAYKITHCDSFLVNAKRIGAVGNFCARGPGFVENKAVELVPDICQVLPFPLEILKLAHLFPSILHQIKQFALVDEVRLEFDLPLIQNPTLYAAFSSTNSGNYSNFERLELLGDSFLKYATSVEVFNRYPTADEGILTQSRSNIINNKFLYDIGVSYGVQDFLFLHPFDPKHFTPFGRTNLTPVIELETRYIGKKMLADCVESLIGACYMNGGHDTAKKLLYKLGVLTSNSNELKKSSLFHDKYLHCTVDTCVGNERKGDLVSWNPETNMKITEKGAIEKVQDILGYSFNNRSLALEAFTHSSSTALSRFQRFEFLGDGVLDWLVSRCIFNSFRDSGPGVLSIGRQDVVSNENLGKAIVMKKLHEFLGFDENVYKGLRDHLVSFFGFLEKSDLESLYSQDFKFDVPKILGDLFESIVGVIFVDSDMNSDVVWECISEILVESLKRCGDPLTIQKSPIRIFAEFLQKNKFDMKCDVDFEILKLDTDLYECIVYLPGRLVAGRGKGSTQGAAKKQCCIQGLEEIEKKTSPVFKLILDREIKSGERE